MPEILPGILHDPMLSQTEMISPQEWLFHHGPLLWYPMQDHQVGEVNGSHGHTATVPVKERDAVPFFCSRKEKIS
jgi:hypothetical protein